jgi:RNA polymerase primary sigma factor
MSDAADAVFFDDPLRVYLTELSSIPPLDSSEEVTCIEHVRADDEMAEACRKRLVEANLQLVVTLAERHLNERFHLLELIQKGNEGLLQAARSLSNCPPNSFAAHATKFIERALIESPKTDQTDS